MSVVVHWLRRSNVGKCLLSVFDVKAPFMSRTERTRQHSCPYPGLFAEYAHALLTLAHVNYTLTVIHHGISDYGGYDEANG